MGIKQCHSSLVGKPARQNPSIQVRVYIGLFMYFFWTETTFEHSRSEGTGRESRKEIAGIGFSGKSG